MSTDSYGDAFMPCGGSFLAGAVLARAGSGRGNPQWRRCTRRV